MALCHDLVHCASKKEIGLYGEPRSVVGDVVYALQYKPPLMQKVDHLARACLSCIQLNKGAFHVKVAKPTEQLLTAL